MLIGLMQRPEMVRLLYQHGAKAETPDMLGRTEWSFAQTCTHNEPTLLSGVPTGSLSISRHLQDSHRPIFGNTSVSVSSANSPQEARVNDQGPSTSQSVSGDLYLPSSVHALLVERTVVGTLQAVVNQVLICRHELELPTTTSRILGLSLSSPV